MMLLIEVMSQAVKGCHVELLSQSRRVGQSGRIENEAHCQAAEDQIINYCCSRAICKKIMMHRLRGREQMVNHD